MVQDFVRTVHEFPKKSLIHVFDFDKQRLNAAKMRRGTLPRSGGFLEHIFKEAARELLGALELYPSNLDEFNPIVSSLRFAIDLSSPLTLQTKQNEDMREAD